MSSVEILIPHPEINKDKHRGYSYKNPELKSLISDQIQLWHVSPTTHPRVVDLCSGDGSLAHMMTELGWQPDNITCIDLCISPTPKVQDVHWKYMNLKNLAFSLKYNWDIPPEVNEYRHTFDVVTEWLGFLGEKDRFLLSHFFSRPGGYILNEGIVKE